MRKDAFAPDLDTRSFPSVVPGHVRDDTKPSSPLKMGQLHTHTNAQHLFFNLSAGFQNERARTLMALSEQTYCLHQKNISPTIPFITDSLLTNAIC